MKLKDFIDKLRLAHDVPNYYNNHFPKNLGYYDGQRFSFDCWNLIKAVLSGWTDNRTVGYYVHTNELVTGDIDGYTMLKKCSGRSKDFSKLKQVGTYLYIYKSPHAGVYIGDFEIDGYWFNVVECTGAWDSKVQYTYVDEKGGRYLYKGGSKSPYSWEEYGLLPWVEYDEKPTPIPEPEPITNVAFGVDVSRWQKGFNLGNALSEGFTYAIIKAGGADSGYYKDGSYENFYAQAKALGMKIGAYYYGNAFSTEDALQEANYFISYLKDKQITHVYYDVEGRMLNQGYTHLTDIINVFCQTMINNGYACGIYTSESHFNSRFDDAKLIMFPHWVARYSKTPPKLNSIALVEIWQYGGSVNYVRDPKIKGTTVDQDQINIQWVDEPKLTAQPVEVAIIDKKNVDQLANEVLAGEWGNGIIRKAKLTLAGYDYYIVQRRVEEIIAERSSKGKKYVVVKGDTLSGIGRRFGVDWHKIAEDNGIEKPYVIQIGQYLQINK